MNRRLFLLLCFLAGFALAPSCATSSPYRGEPPLSISYLRHFVRDDPRLPPRIETLATANLANATDHAITVVLDCTKTLHTVTIAPKSVEHVLLDPGDDHCEVRR